MESMIDILERQRASIKFNDGKVEYFSISTQHNSANTIEEAVNSILDADKLFNGEPPSTQNCIKLMREQGYDYSEIAIKLQNDMRKAIDKLIMEETMFKQIF